MPYLFKSLEEMGAYYFTELGAEKLNMFPIDADTDAVYAFIMDKKLESLKLFKDSQLYFLDPYSKKEWEDWDEAVWKADFNARVQGSKKRGELGTVAGIFQDSGEFGKVFTTINPSMLYFIKKAPMMIHGDVIKVAVKVMQLELGSKELMSDILQGDEEDIRELLKVLEREGCTKNEAGQALDLFRVAVKTPKDEPRYDEATALEVPKDNVIRIDGIYYPISPEGRVVVQEVTYDLGYNPKGVLAANVVMIEGEPCLVMKDGLFSEEEDKPLYDAGDNPRAVDVVYDLGEADDRVGMRAPRATKALRSLPQQVFKPIGGPEEEIDADSPKP
jgi:hypothetical protein